MKNKKYHTVGTIQKTISKIVLSGNIYTPNTKYMTALSPGFALQFNYVFVVFQYFDMYICTIKNRYLN